MANTNKNTLKEVKITRSDLVKEWAKNAKTKNAKVEIVDYLNAKKYSKTTKSFGVAFVYGFIVDFDKVSSNGLLKSTSICSNYRKAIEEEVKRRNAEDVELYKGGKNKGKEKHNAGDEWFKTFVCNGVEGVVYSKIMIKQNEILSALRMAYLNNKMLFDITDNKDGTITISKSIKYIEGLATTK